MTGELTNHLWQSTLFAAAAGLLTIAFRENRAQVRYWLWLSASCKFLVPFVFLLNLGSQLDWTPAAERVTPPAVSLAIQQMAEPFSYVPGAAPSPPAATRDWAGPAIFGVWACGFISIVLVRLRGWRQIQAAIGASVPMNISSAVEVRSSSELVEPGIVGWWHPVLLLPAGITDRLTRLQLNAVLAHELCHVRRRDNFTAAIHMLVESAFWFHPLVWWIGGRLIEERERACDEEVLRLGNEPEVYAEGILNVCKSYLESPLRCVSGVTGSDLKKRIQTILTGHVAGDLSFARKVGLAIAGMASVAAPFAVGVMNAPALRGQSKEKLTFEVASVKRSAPVTPGQRVFFGPPRGGPGTPDPGQITWTYVRMKSLITTAYDVKDYQVSGPGWLDTERYDVVVKVPLGATREQVRVMWQNLLAERFGVQMHHDSKEFRAQELVIAKSGSKLKESVEDPGAPIPEGPPKVENGELKSAGQMNRIIRDQNGLRAHTTARAQPLSQLAQMLSNQLSMPVLDKTGLAGKYDYNLEFVPNIGGMGMPPPPPGAAGPSPAASASDPETDVASAIQQQLGLRLVASKAQLDVVVIDKAEKVPTDN